MFEYSPCLGYVNYEAFGRYQGLIKNDTFLYLNSLI